MKAQTVTFKRSISHEWETGLAFLPMFSISNILFIIDEYLATVPQAQVYDYRLIDGPLSFIDTNYGE